ncbi:nuclear transport factor 2 family protein [Sphingosinicella ginsenosidimutans]|uniref:Nuclear transport factor 2 family protein n=1 Tax=Allosphingosinicella ginsenosidimutans TaxID=1176539 RepID=A0A5C6TUR8_9SPHN|nr:nuclear transport factor 2 family protein [Sphingosinicella ginsenosidimutans]TXC64026.1 nuclear transport factor 2 family protein [Sphingosinicella ginsenosidimutans]
MDDALQILLDKQACVELVYRFARGLDRCDEAIVRSVFHADGTDDHGQFKGTVDEFVAWVFPVLATMERTQHVIGNVLVEVDGDRAWAESYFVAYHDLVNAYGGSLRTTVAGRYLDRFERRGGEWRISHRKFVSDWSASDARSDMWDREAPGPRIFGRRDRDDPLYAEMARTQKVTA